MVFNYSPDKYREVEADRNKYEFNRKDIAHQQFRLKNRFENIVSIGVKQ